MLTFRDLDKTRWMLLPGLELFVFWRGGMVVVYYLVGPPLFSNLVRTWVLDELEDKRAATGLALTLGEA